MNVGSVIVEEFWDRLAGTMIRVAHEMDREMWTLEDIFRKVFERAPLKKEKFHSQGLLR